MMKWTIFFFLQLFSLQAFADFIFTDLGVAGGAFVGFFDPDTRQFGILSGSGVGTGQTLQNPTGIAVNESGQVFVADLGSDSLLKIDPVTGNRVVIKDRDPGLGIELAMPTDMAFGPNGDLIVLDTQSGILRIDSVTGFTTRVTGFGNDVIGSGPLFQQPTSIRYINGILLVSDEQQNALFEVDLASGNRSIISSNTVGQGPLFNDPEGIAETPTGDLFVYNTNDGTAFEIDLDTGNRTALPEYPLVTALSGVPFGSSKVALLNNDTISTFDLSTREFNILGASGAVRPQRIALLSTVPEPSSFFLAVAAVACIVTRRSRYASD